MLSEQDLSLVHALQEAPRASWATLAASLGTDTRTLARRYAKLTEAGLLRVMATAGPRLTGRILFAHLRIRATPGRASGVAEQLAQWSQASTVRLTDGSHDVHAVLVGVDHTRLMRSVHEVLADMSDVQHAEIRTVLHAADVGRAARLDALSSAQVAGLRTNASQTRARTTSRFRPEDFEILQRLLHNGRSEVAELAGQLGRDPSVMSRRLTRLQRDGFLDLVALIPDTAWSAPVRALLWCSVPRHDVSTLLRSAGNLPWVGLMTAVTGSANVLVVANVTTTAAVSAAHETLAERCRSLRIVETQLSPRALKLHMCELDEHDRFTDEVSDPFAGLRDELLGG